MTSEHLNFVLALEKRSMSSWTKEEMAEYERITGQYENADVDAVSNPVQPRTTLITTLNQVLTPLESANEGISAL